MYIYLYYGVFERFVSYIACQTAHNRDLLYLTCINPLSVLAYNQVGCDLFQ